MKNLFSTAPYVRNDSSHSTRKLPGERQVAGRHARAWLHSFWYALSGFFSPVNPLVTRGLWMVANCTLPIRLQELLQGTASEEIMWKYNNGTDDRVSACVSPHTP